MPSLAACHPAGSTDTSLWTHYKNGAREYCGNSFPDGMAKNQRLAANVITPTTKSETHDVPISPAEIVAQVRYNQQPVGTSCWESAGSFHDAVTVVFAASSVQGLLSHAE
jgi:hypothetical protein